LSILTTSNDKGPARLSYEPYYFSERTIFFSHNKSANSTFSHGFSAKQTRPKLKTKKLYISLKIHFDIQSILSNTKEKDMIFLKRQALAHD